MEKPILVMCFCLAVPAIAAPLLDAPGPGYRQMKEGTNLMDRASVSPVIQTKVEGAGPVRVEEPKPGSLRILGSHQPFKFQLGSTALAH